MPRIIGVAIMQGGGGSNAKWQLSQKVKTYVQVVFQHRVLLGVGLGNGFAQELLKGHHDSLTTQHGVSV